MDKDMLVDSLSAIGGCKYNVVFAIPFRMDETIRLNSSEIRSIGFHGVWPVSVISQSGQHPLADEEAHVTFYPAGK